MFTKKLRLSALISLVALAMLGVKCDNPTDGGDPPEPKEFTVTVTAEDDGQQLSGVTFTSGNRTKEDASSIDVSGTEGTSTTVEASKNGYETNSQTVTFNANKSVAIELEKKEPTTPETVTISYEAKDSEADSLVAAETLTFEGETVVENSASGEFELDYSESAGDLCGFHTYFTEENNCVELTPDADKPVTVTLTRQQVEISFTVNRKSDGGSVDNPEISVESWYDQTYTYGSGERTHAFGARGGNRDISVTAEGYQPYEAQVLADAAHDLTVELQQNEPTYACSDGDDNDGDGLTDEDDPGCVDSEGNYDPEDDVEQTRIRQITLPGSKGDTTFISGAEGEREKGLIPREVSDIDFSVIKASVSILVKFEVLVEADQDGEEFALKWKTGPSDDNLNNTFMTDIVEDEGKDGWKDVKIQIPKSYFPDGGSYEVNIVHASKVRGDPPTDGNDDVVGRTPNKAPSFVIEIEYEDEEVDN